MKNALHTQNEIESDWNEMKSSNGGAANSRCPASAGSVELERILLSQMINVCEIALEQRKHMDGNDGAYCQLVMEKLKRQQAENNE